MFMAENVNHRNQADQCTPIINKTSSSADNVFSEICPANYPSAEHTTGKHEMLNRMVLLEHFKERHKYNTFKDSYRS
jgi:hypothetical protein